jgi:hypothetical protein
MWRERNERGIEGDPPCETCRVVLARENEEIAEVYFQVRSQVIATYGQVIGLSIPAVKIVMDLYGIKDQKTCLTRIMKTFYHFLNKHRAEKE